MGLISLMLVIVIGIFALILIKDYNRKQQYHQNGEVEKLQREVDELRQRIANLETIVTDKSYDLKDKINRL
ncbi:hypothetical protein AYI72_21255 [Shewanella algae]|uniref:hypothetical protein n=1 Tax=Shewanella algae TaxID=38313 RepID=UPI000E335CCF|nr:hypothetical protein [Shewanella algae]AXQ14953.1 hypothetical protein BS332_12275 [Shewanella algae]QXP17867.1 hypothetical protein KE621_12320 [Shewanella algae]QXP31136.1 hypothetical protein KE622_07050 [Shewanella algae]QXP35600.1 hypothetical protein KE623_08560 [Shewanella algae]QXP36595.1 hypothetical protein KE624_11905 [Shewanella algae]